MTVITLTDCLDAAGSGLALRIDRDAIAVTIRSADHDDPSRCLVEAGDLADAVGLLSQGRVRAVRRLEAEAAARAEQALAEEQTIREISLDKAQSRISELVEALEAAEQRISELEAARTGQGLPDPGSLPRS